MSISVGMTDGAMRVAPHALRVRRVVIPAQAGIHTNVGGEGRMGKTGLSYSSGPSPRRLDSAALLLL